MSGAAARQPAAASAGHLVPPGMRQFREAMAQQHQRSLAGDGHTHAQAVDLQFAVFYGHRVHWLRPPRGEHCLAVGRRGMPGDAGA
jgi:hypothetical protein